MRERDVEDYLVKRVKAMGGEVRKVKWIGRNSAPDRLVMLPPRVTINGIGMNNLAWVELKNPKTVASFPADPREHAQAREHRRMRAMGQRVEVIGTLAGVEELLS
jgi:hypothetical protein